MEASFFPSIVAFIWIGILLMLGTYLRAKVPFLQRILFPASLIGGLIGFVLINAGWLGVPTTEGWKAIDQAPFGTLTFHLPGPRSRGTSHQGRFFSALSVPVRTHAEDCLWPPSEAGGDARPRARTEMVGAVMLSLSGNARFRARREDRIHRSQSPVPQGPSPHSRGISCGDLFPDQWSRPAPRPRGTSSRGIR